MLPMTRCDASSLIHASVSCGDVGWQRPWVDGISDRLFKREFTLTVDPGKGCGESATSLVLLSAHPGGWGWQCLTVQLLLQVEFLHTLHIQPDNICNMMTIAPRALSLDVGSTLKPIIEYIQAQGVSGAARAA